MTQKLKFVSVRIENIVGKGEKLVTSIFSFNSPIINLDQSKNLLFGKELKILWCLWLELEL